MIQRDRLNPMPTLRISRFLDLPLLAHARTVVSHHPFAAPEVGCLLRIPESG